jgi:glycosyltransferase involved in cell wall biosynthesis
MTRSGISVIIPAYNRADLIRQTLASLLNQTLPADEIIVVDDGSSDGTAEAAEAAFHRWESEKAKGKRWEGGKLPEFKVIRQGNSGPGAARNLGFAESKGEFIHFFDSDDIAAPNKHEVQVRALQETGADIAYGPWVKGRIVADEPPHGAWSMEPGEQRYHFEPEGHVLQQKGLPHGDLVKELLTRWSIVPQACMFRRSIIEKSGGFPDDMFVAEDQLVCLRCLLAGARVVHTPQTLAFYRLGDAGKLTESAEGHRRRITDWAVFLERSRKECVSRGIVPEKWFNFRMRLRSAQRERAALLGLNDSLPAAVGESVFGAVARLRKWWGGLMVRLTGNRQNSSFRCGRLTPAQVALFPTS